MSQAPTLSTPEAEPRDGFEVLDVCHRHIVLALGKMSAVIARLSTLGPDRECRAMAREVERFFSTTVRQHHEDEERHVFPQVLLNADEDMVQAVSRLQQDHNWLEEDWMELSPHLVAVAEGQSWYDVDVLREGAAVFTALLHDHIALEESVVYPASRGRLALAQRREMGREMAARRRQGRASVARGER
jgi:hemerythrin-like domain-containing protein